jgi:hypothetical protein
MTASNFLVRKAKRKAPRRKFSVAGAGHGWEKKRWVYNLFDFCSLYIGIMME